MRNSICSETGPLIYLAMSVKSWEILKQLKLCIFYHFILFIFVCYFLSYASISFVNKPTDTLYILESYFCTVTTDSIFLGRQANLKTKYFTSLFPCLIEGPQIIWPISLVASQMVLHGSRQCNACSSSNLL
jgi:hypothetical protein